MEKFGAKESFHFRREVLPSLKTPFLRLFLAIGRAYPWGPYPSLPESAFQMGLFAATGNLFGLPSKAIAVYFNAGR
jgi:hypothetical protein